MMTTTGARRAASTRWTRIRIVVAMVALVAALAPSHSAVAAANATVRLAEGSEVTPAPSQRFSLELNNTEPGGLLGGGRSINIVDILLPAGTAGIVNNNDPVSPPSGWTAQRLSQGVLQRIRFQTTGSGLAPASRIFFTFPAAVEDSPVNRTGRFEVNVSSDGAVTTRRAVPSPAGSTNVQVMVMPATPTITEATRNAGAEPAYFDNDEGRYYTRFGGTDFEVTFTGAREGDTAQVLDEAGNVVATSGPLTNPDPGAPEGAPFEARIRVPLHDSDGSYIRRLRLVTSGGAIGSATDFGIVLDTVSPEISSATLIDPRTVHVVFTERIVRGTDFAGDWFAYESTPDGRQLYEAETVEVVSHSERRMTFAFQGDGPFGGVSYVLSGLTSQRYQDRAGNLMSDF